jgi:hypothetical protein
LLAHTRTLEGNTAKYPLFRVDVKSITICKDIISKSVDNLFIGQLPKLLEIGFVFNTALDGSSKLNPFNFQHFDVNSLYTDGRQIPSKPLQSDFSSGNPSYISSYLTLFLGTNISFRDDGNCISRTQYPYGNCLHVFDITPDLSASGQHWSLNRQGTLRLEVKFKVALPETISYIIYSEFNSIIEIDSYHSVILDYSG